MTANEMKGADMGRLSRSGRTTGLVTMGVIVGGALAWSGVSAAEHLSRTGAAQRVTVVTESRKVPHGYLDTNVVCPKGRRAISGGYAYYGDHNLEKPLIVEENAPGRTSDKPDAVADAWNLFFLNSKDKTITVEVHVICMPID
ncbi:hypothetical protein FH608_014225 [Nonomuraea phyllanthi]|uniref:Uncharacterized protein n=1 Tax=Nonomuraea phyllanthi TaxID=2219224 RepID=A0A5C4WP90_9ACTN|nr:hypothetical protein [Nonomuraea phyllanthi]KAB8195483.1 hypothetical protein FH608_014225 [Nonomuraea phyllanthi]